MEKPKLGSAPSNFAIIGQYVLTPEILMFLDNQEVGAGGEIPQSKLSPFMLGNQLHLLRQECSS